MSNIKIIRYCEQSHYKEEQLLEEGYELVQVVPLVKQYVEYEYIYQKIEKKLVNQ